MNGGARQRIIARSQSLPDLLLRTFDFLLAAVALVAPLLMGGRHPVGELVYVALVAIAAVVWTTRQAMFIRGSWQLTGVEFLLTAAVLIVGVQLVSLPEGWLNNLAPLHGQLLPMWSGESSSSLGSWATISLSPHATRGQLTVLLAHVMLFTVVMQRLRDIEDVQRLSRCIAVAAVGMACLGLAQFLICNEKFLWIYEHPSRVTSNAVKGMFANENHFASFLALGLAPLIVWAAMAGGSTDNRSQQSRGSSKRRTWASGGHKNHAGDDWQGLALLVALGVVAFAGLLTFSRGGVVVLAISGAVTTGCLAFAGVVGRRWLVSLGVASIVIAGAILLYGYEPLTRQLSTLSSGDMEQLDRNGARTMLWKADLEAVKRSPYFGTGAGSHAEIYPVFLQQHFPNEFTHAESSYIQILLETGVSGLLVCVALLGTIFYAAVRAFTQAASKQEKALAAAVLGGLSASAVHAVADFAWFLPSCMTLTILLGACGCRLWQLRSPDARAERAESPSGTIPLSGFAWTVTAILVAGLGVLMIANRTGPALACGSWERFLALRRAEGDSDDDVRGDVLLQPIVETLSHDPDNARANVRMAAICMRRFEEEQRNSEVPLPLSQIRDAVTASDFGDLQQQNAWLERITGDNRRWLDLAYYHTNRALQLCPLQGEAYVLLAELSFLEGPQGLQHQVLLEQALTVRPYDAQVLFAVGRDAALVGDDEKAIALWRDAFHRERKCRRQIIALIGPRISAEAFMDHFDPTRAHLSELFRYYRSVELAESAATVAGRLAQLTDAQARDMTGAEGSALWSEAHGYYNFIHDDINALRCIENAVALAPHNYGYRRSLAEQLLRHRQYERAIDELLWCRRQKSNDPKVARLWAMAQRGPAMEDLEETAANHDVPDNVR